MFRQGHGGGFLQSKTVASASGGPAFYGRLIGAAVPGALLAGALQTILAVPAMQNAGFSPAYGILLAVLNSALLLVPLLGFALLFGLACAAGRGRGWRRVAGALLYAAALIFLVVRMAPPWRMKVGLAGSLLLAPCLIFGLPWLLERLEADRFLRHAALLLFGAVSVGAFLFQEYPPFARLLHPVLGWLTQYVSALLFGFAAISSWKTRRWKAVSALCLEVAACAVAGSVYLRSEAVRSFSFAYFRSTQFSEFILRMNFAGNLSPFLRAEDLTLPKLGRPWSLLPARQPAAGSDPALFMLVTVDALRADLGQPGGTGDALPNWGQLKSNSLVYARAYTLATSTNPSLSNVVTSRGCTFAPRGRHLVLPLVLSREGIRTVFVGSELLKNGHAPVGFDSIFDEFALHKQPGDLLAATEARLTSKGRGSLFLWVHLPYLHWETYRRETWNLVRPSAEQYRQQLKLVDAAIGMLTGVFHRSSFTRKALLVTGDHGEAFGEHGEYGHGGRFAPPEMLSIPLLLWSPALAPGRSLAPVTLADIAPTVLEFFGIAVPAGELEGKSLWSPQSLPGDRAIFIGPGVNYRVASVIYRNWRLDYILLNRSGRLFDLASDPSGYRDVQQQHPEVAANLKALLLARLQANPCNICAGGSPKACLDGAVEGSVRALLGPGGTPESVPAGSR